MTRIPSVMPASISLGAVLLLGWGCATVPPNRSPNDPFVQGEPRVGPQQQRNARPEYTVPPYAAPQYTLPQNTVPQNSVPKGQPLPPTRPVQPQPYPYRSPAPLRTPNPGPPRTTPKTFADPDPNAPPVPPRRPGTNPAQPFRTDKVPAPRRPRAAAFAATDSEEAPAPVTPENLDGPKLFPPEETHSASTASLPKTTANNESVELVVSAPERRPVGSGDPFQLTIKNASAQILRNVNVVCEFDQELTFPGSDRKSVTHKIPKIDIGNARESLLTLVSDVPGVYQCRFTVNVGSKPVVHKTVGVEFVSRQLDWHIHGPAERTVGSRAEFNIPLINVTDRNLKHVTVRVDLDSALTVREMTKGGKLGDRSILWTIDNVAANEGMLLQLEVECHEPTMQACLTATVSGDDVPADDAEACLTVKPVTGLLDVRVQDVTDPVAVGEDAELSVTIVNPGLQPAKDVVVTCRWPEGFDFVSAALVKGSKTTAVKAAARDHSLVLPAISRLEPDQRIEYRIKLSASRAGAHQLTVSVKDSTTLTPVEVIEPIMVHR